MESGGGGGGEGLDMAGHGWTCALGRFTNLGLIITTTQYPPSQTYVTVPRHGSMGVLLCYILRCLLFIEVMK